MQSCQTIAAIVCISYLCTCASNSQEIQHALPTDNSIYATFASDGSTEATFPALKSPSSVVDRIPPQEPLALLNSRFLFGAYACEQLECPQVTADECRAVFTPDWQGDSHDMAYAYYGFNMEYYEGSSDFTLEWEGEPPPEDELFLGLGNFGRDRWEWHPGTVEPLTVESLAPYIDEDGYLLLAVIVLGSGTYALNSVGIGDRVIQESVDMSMLCAPPLNWEKQVMDAEFAARNPVEQEYSYVAEMTAGEWTYAVISHEVDELTHYGVLRIPPTVGEEKHPILLLCHPGMEGTGINDYEWLSNLVSDPDVFNEYFVIMPSFRGEVTYGHEMGVFTSEGSLNIYDHDSDDAIAMLDCVLNHFPQADGDTIIATGWSRGAQVAMRVAARDQRIDAVLEFAGWTNEWTVSGQSYAFYALPELVDEPQPGGAMYEYNHKLWELKNGVCDIWDMRQLMLRMSVAYSAVDLPHIQIHHGVKDKGVPIGQAESFAAWLAWEPGAEYEYFSYPLGDHYVWNFDGAGERARDFLASFLSE